MKTLPTWHFDNSYARLPSIFYTKQKPIPVRTPQLIIFNHTLADHLGIPMEPDIFAGNLVPSSAEPLAQAYAGHQFGHFTMLGDGRALLLGEQITPSGERFDIQLKGSGKTKYSRGGDGRAALGPMLREYIMSEAMHALKIPTTRSLAVLTTGETVQREKKLPGAILTRVAASHIRVGTFEYAAHFGTVADVRCLADYTIVRHFPHITADEDKYLALLKEVSRQQANLIARWQLIGFIHGVMNTDNMAISGETIDYGPCAFMDTYHPDTVFSSIDTHGRYAYQNQPKIAAWNLARLAETLLPLLHDDTKKAILLAQDIITDFEHMYHENWRVGMSAKLGLDDNAENESIIHDLLQLMQQHKADYTNTFRALTTNEKKDMALFTMPDFRLWYDRWQSVLSRQHKSMDEINASMQKHNPAIIPRNHRMEEALAAAEQGDYAMMEKWLLALQDPYAYSLAQDEFAALPADTQTGASCYKTFCGT